MAENNLHTGEILFIKAVKDGIPNRDPLRESDARRVFGEDDGRISLSDVSIKRDVRDYLIARFPDGGPDKSMFVFVRKERTGENKLMGRDKLAESLLKKAGQEKAKDLQRALMSSAFDMRIFGAVFSVAKKSFNQCGPVQFGWAHSLHPVETRYVQGTVVMPAKDVEVREDSGEEEGGATQGTIWTSYTLPFAVFAMPGVINSSIGSETGMTGRDVEVLLEALWKGTHHRQARGRGIQQPVLLLHVEYRDPFVRIGFLEESITLEPGREAWLGPRPPAALGEVTLDVSRLGALLQQHQSQIARCRLWLAPQASVRGDVPAETGTWPDGAAA